MWADGFLDGRVKQVRQRPGAGSTTTFLQPEKVEARIRAQLEAARDSPAGAPRRRTLLERRREAEPARTQLR